MGIARRIAELYEAKVNALLGRVEDPAEMLDYSYERQRELLTGVRRGMVEVSASRRRSQQQASQLESAAAHLKQQAEQAAAAGSDDLARQALARRTELLDRASGLRAQEAGLKADEERLTAIAQRLRAKVEAFGLRKEVIKADYTAARASAGAGAEFTGISEEMADVGQATRRAEDRTAQARAHADALDDLLASGALGGELPATPPAPAGQPAAGRPGPGRLQEQLDEVTTRAAVEKELAAIKERLHASGEPGQGEIGEGGAGEGGAGEAHKPR